MPSSTVSLLPKTRTHRQDRHHVKRTRKQRDRKSQRRWRGPWWVGGAVARILLLPFLLLHEPIGAYYQISELLSLFSLYLYSKEKAESGAVLGRVGHEIRGWK